MNEGGFQAQVIARGICEDASSIPDKVYVIETIIIRLNQVALNEWIMSEEWNERGCYNTDGEWEEYKTKKAVMRKAWEAKVAEMLCIEIVGGSLCIREALAEFFSVVYIREAEGER